MKIQLPLGLFRSVTEGCITWLQNVRYFRWKCALDKDEYHLFPLFLAHILRFRRPPWKAWNWWNLVKAHIGHMDNYETYSNESKMFRLGKQALVVSEKINLFRNLFFRWKAQKKPYACSMMADQNFRFPSVETETLAMYRKRPAARNWRHQTPRSTLLAVWC